MPGSSLTWINKTVYKRALKKRNDTRWAKPYLGRSFQYEYSAGKIKGELFMDTLSFRDKTIFVKGQIFGIVDEVQSPEARRWRKDEDIDVVGIFGIGPSSLNKNSVLAPNGEVARGKTVPTVLDTMMKEGRISAKIIGVNFCLPLEGTDAGTVKGQLHFGAPKQSAYNISSMKVIPATKRGESQHFYGIDLTLKYSRTVLMDNKPGIIDSGSNFISLPEEVLDAYVQAVGNHKDGTPIVTYDKTTGMYRIAKKDYGRLKDLIFDFVEGGNAKFKLSPAAQVFPPVLTKGWGTDSNDALFLSFRRLKNAHEGRQFTLGVAWSKFTLKYLIEQ